MTLADVIRKLDPFRGSLEPMPLGDELCIYASPHWSPTSRAAVAREPEDGSVPELATGMTYLTTVGEAKRVIADRRARRPDRVSTIEDVCSAVIYYAIYNETEPLASDMSADDITLPLAI
jgi:hypothetical protein